MNNKINKIAEYRIIKAERAGKLIFVNLSKDNEIQAVRNSTDNRDLLISTWHSEKADITAPRTYSIVFQVVSNNIETSRTNALELIYYVEEKFGIPSENLIIIFNYGGGKNERAKDGTATSEIIILIASPIFGSLPTSLLPALNYHLARQIADDGINNIDIDVYQRDHFTPLPNSINSTTSRYIIPLTLKELMYLDEEKIIELSNQPRPDDLIIAPPAIPEAVEFFEEAYKEFQKKVLQQDELQKFIQDQGWEIPPCIRRWLRLSLFDNVRLEIYREISQFLSWIGASESEIRYQIQNMDRRNPIDNYQKLNNIVTFGYENPWFVGCEHSLFQKFCPGYCFIADMIKEYQQPRLF